MAPHLLIGDIGSTKSTWRSGGTPAALTLSGYNPLQHGEIAGRRMLDDLSAALDPADIGELWYYGAGIAGPVQAEAVTRLLAGYFPSAVIHVHSDLLGAARAACGHAPGTVAILGTGSHAAVFNGREIIRQAQALGYILGDEGGGCDLGKALIRAYFYRTMPDHLAIRFASRLPGDRGAFLQALAASSAPNQYLASFARFISDDPQDEWLTALVRERFAHFIRTHVVSLRPAGPVHVVGSVGCIFADLFEAELTRAGLTAGRFIREPAETLFELHHQDGRHQE